LLRIERTKESDEATIRFLDSLRTRAIKGESFAELARKYSERAESSVGGNLGTVEADQIQHDMYAAIDSLKDGDISRPVKVPEGSSYKYHIVWVRKRTPAHKMTLEADYHKVESIALNLKRSKDIQQWIAGLRTTIYWQSRLTE
jgi:peptidyl-prolyl cis-trans isomerase SurA